MIRWDSEQSAHVDVSGRLPWPSEPVPVVPCDDAAIERAARAIEDELEGRSGGDAFLYEMAEDVREEMLRAIAERVLRAAGETA